MIKIRVEPIETNIKLKLDDKIVVYRAGEPQIKEVEYVENGEYSVEPDAKCDLEEVRIKVNVPLPEGKIDITNTDEYDVYSYAKAQIKDDNLKAENIAEDVEVLGIKGTFRGGIDTSDGTITPDKILKNEVGYAKEQRVVGTIETWDGSMSDGAEIENSLVTFLNDEKTHYTKKDLEGATSIKHYMWYQNDTVVSVELPDSVESLGQRAFSQVSKLISIKLSKNLKSLGAYCFTQSRGIEEIELPNTLTTIGGYAFMETGLKSIIIPDSVTSAVAACCLNCTNLIYAKIGNGIATTGSDCFSGCTNLKEVIVGESVVFISAKSFQNCTSLETITLPARVNTISTNAFNGCTNLKEIIILAPNPPKLESNAFNGVPENCIIKVLADSVEAYKAATNWSIRADYIVEV